MSDELLNNAKHLRNSAERFGWSDKRETDRADLLGRIAIGLAYLMEAMAAEMSGAPE